MPMTKQERDELRAKVKLLEERPPMKGVAGEEQHAYCYPATPTQLRELLDGAEPRPRTLIQIALCPANEHHDSGVAAVANDGTAWFLQGGQWVPLPPLPQGEPEG